MERCEQYSLLLLAGGKSARMGTPKAELMYEGKTFLDHMLDKAHALGIRNCYISGYASAQEDVTTVWDHFPDRGPLGGLHACMKSITTPYCLVLPVDAPKLPVEILEALIHRHEQQANEKVLIWEHGVRQEPLIAIYPTAMADFIGNLIREHAAPVFRAIDSWGFDSFRMEMPEEQIININTPELYKKLLGEDIDTAREKAAKSLIGLATVPTKPCLMPLATPTHKIPIRIASNNIFANIFYLGNLVFLPQNDIALSKDVL